MSVRSATNSERFVPCTRLRVGERVFLVQQLLTNGMLYHWHQSVCQSAPRLWIAALPTDIKRAANLLTFKKKLKTFLFSKHLCLFYCILSSPFWYTLHIYV